MSLLGVGTDAKTVKGEKYGVRTAVMYLAPSDISGYQVCAMAKIAQCEAPCLYKAGRGAFNSIQQARIRKTKRFFEDREQFMVDLFEDIMKFVMKCIKDQVVPLIRLNGTSDIKWENVPVLGAPNIMALFPDVTFYDYTKLANRTDLPENYDLTFSYSGVPAYQPYVKKAMSSNMRIATVFRSIPIIPETFLGKECIDGDDSDLRPYDPQGVIVALYAKGPAKKDTSGFVVG